MSIAYPPRAAVCSYPLSFCTSPSPSLTRHLALFSAAMISSSITPILETPTLDAESASILHRVIEEGGHTFAGMATLAADGDIQAAEAMLDMAWEQLHSGPWHSVPPAWRDAYSMACLQKAKFHFAAAEFKEALRVLDLGIIMGGRLLREDLDSSMEKVSMEKRKDMVLEGNQDMGKIERRLDSEDFNWAEVLKLLPRKALSCKTVARRSALSLERFLMDYFIPGCPVIISDCMDHWPARMRWNNLDYLEKVAADRTVPVEVGKNYLCPEWKQELITFSEFLQRIQSADCNSSTTTYLAQHPLFDQINELRNDIVVPDYCFAGGGELKSLNAWFGPAGTVTPLHHDPHHNILAQVVGKKYIRLYSASLSEELHPYVEPMLCNSSQVDLDNIDEQHFPEVQDLEFVDCILGGGELLYIPPKWWHYVRSLTASLSVSFWWSESPTPS